MTNWIEMGSATPVSEVSVILPRAPGIYAFFVDHLDSLPGAFRLDTRSRPESHLMYIGKADISLHQRVWEEECHHRRPGTFFRSVGAMLGYRSPCGGNNYTFAPSDKALIVNWIQRHLLVAWKTEEIVGSIKAKESDLIKRLTPLLNINGNPRKFAELQGLRAICRKGQS